MRLTCPNCGAQYEVPDEVIPLDGRDVQCSNCGETWFQAHPDAAEPAAVEHAPEPFEEDLDQSKPEPEPEQQPMLEPEPVSEDQPTPEGQQTEARADLSDTDGADDDDDDAPIDHPLPPKPGPEVTKILQEEAERESQLRAAERGGLETQPDLGIEEQPDDEAARRSRESRERMARMRGEEIGELPASDLQSRKERLPDIDALNSSLDASMPDGQSVLAEGTVVAKSRGGFIRGFLVVVIIAAILVAIYANADKISASVPAAESVLSSYVSLVDQARLWLESQVGQVSPK